MKKSNLDFNSIGPLSKSMALDTYLIDDPTSAINRDFGKRCACSIHVPTTQKCYEVIYVLPSQTAPANLMRIGLGKRHTQSFARKWELCPFGQGWALKCTNREWGEHQSSTFYLVIFRVQRLEFQFIEYVFETRS